MALEALNHLHDYASGDTRPQLFACLNSDATERWVLKLMGKADNELAADWIGCLLAHELELPCPKVEIANVTADALATAPAEIRAWAKPGPAFASRELSHVNPGFRTPLLLRRARIEDLSTLYVLDSWLDVLDRYRPDNTWNLLLRNGPDGLAIIDFGKGLSSCFFPIFGQQSGSLAPRYPKGVTSLLHRVVIADTCAKIQVIPQDHLVDLVRSVPVQWLDTAKKSCVEQLLIDRRERLMERCESGLGE